MTYPRLDSYFMLFLTVIHLSINYQTVKQSRKGHTQDTSMTKNIVIEQDKQTAHNMMKSTREKRHMSNINVKTCYDVVPLQEAEQLNIIITKLNDNPKETVLKKQPKTRSFSYSKKQLRSQTKKQTKTRLLCGLLLRGKNVRTFLLEASHCQDVFLF